jgi:DNA-binding transcriptional LysR family regulator
MLETNHLRTFVAVAEELHFGRAADRLNMSQPPVSRQIQLLEQTLRLELFERSKRSVKLTYAGAVFLREARRILSLMEQASTVARNVASGRGGAATCGFTASSGYHFLPVLLRRLKHGMPGVRLSLRELVSVDQIAALDLGELDIAFTRAPTALTGLENALIWREPLVVALPSGHTLADRPAIQWRDLHRQELVMHEPTKGAYFHNLIMGRLGLEGIFPEFVQYLSQTHSILSLVSAGVGLAVVPSSAMVLGFPGIEFRPFEEVQATSSELFVAWRKDNSNPVVPKIAALAIECGQAGV